MNKFIIATIKLYHQKRKEAFEDMINSIRNNTTYPKRKGASVDKVWFWGLKRWGRYFAEKEYDIQKGER